MEFIRGQKSKLSDLTNQLQLEVGITITSAPGQVIDISCFGLDANEKLSDDRYMIFYNQKTSPCDSLAIIGSKNGSTETFKINLSTLPSTIKKLVFTATLDGTSSMSGIGQSSLRLFEGNREIGIFQFSGKDFLEEKAIIIGELYFKDLWRFAANGQGFNGGLAALLKHFGGEEIITLPTFTNHSTTQNMTNSIIGNAKYDKKQPIELRKKGEKICLEKKDSGSIGQIIINLNWNQGVERKGFLKSTFGGVNSIDLDLACLYELKDGTKSVIQALGGNWFGNLNNPPYIALDGDDRTGASKEGENLRINGNMISKIKRILVFTFIYEGATNWQQVDGVVTIKCPEMQDVIVRMDEYNSNQRNCAIAMLENVNNETFTVEKIVQFFHGHIAMDKAFNWGIAWGERGKK